MHIATHEIKGELTPHGFRELTNARRSIEEAELLLVRRTPNTNRAVVVLGPDAPPRQDLASYFKSVRTRVAFRCKFLPLIWGIGIQVVTMAPWIAALKSNPAKYIAVVDNQWAIIQSVFVVDTQAGTYNSGRTWGQHFTGLYQDIISDVLARHFRYSNE